MIANDIGMWTSHGDDPRCMQDFVDNILVTLQNVSGPQGGIIDVSEPVMFSEMSH